MKKDFVSVSNVIKFAGAFVAFLIGSGFATGQEILQYYTSYGLKGVMTASVMFILFVYAGGSFIFAGYKENFHKGSDIFKYYCGDKIGTAYDYFTVAFLFMSYVVMIAGAGATLSQHYGLPATAGAVGMMLLAGGTVIMGLGKIVDIIGKIGPVIILLSVGLGLASIMRSICCFRRSGSYRSSKSYSYESRNKLVYLRMLIRRLQPPLACGILSRPRQKRKQRKRSCIGHNLRRSWVFRWHTASYFRTSSKHRLRGRLSDSFFSACRKDKPKTRNCILFDNICRYIHDGSPSALAGFGQICR